MLKQKRNPQTTRDQFDQNSTQVRPNRLEMLAGQVRTRLASHNDTISKIPIYNIVNA